MIGRPRDMDQKIVALYRPDTASPFPYVLEGFFAGSGVVRQAIETFHAGAGEIEEWILGEAGAETNGVAEVPLTEIAADAFRRQLALAGPGEYLFPTDKKPDTHQKSFKIVWRLVLLRAGVSYFPTTSFDLATQRGSAPAALRTNGPRSFSVRAMPTCSRSILR